KDYPTGIRLDAADFTFNPKNITLNTASATYLQTHYTASGSVDNAIGYALKNEPVAGSLNVHADHIDLNRLMGTVAAPADSNAVKPAANAEPFLVPKNLAFILNATVDKLHYDKVDYSNLKGSIAIKEETIALKDVQMNALDGRIAATGFYSTKKDKKNPDISFTYDVSGLDVQKTFNAFNTVQKLMPAGKFVDGKVNSQLTVNGKLDGSMSPDLTSLTGKGNLNMIDGVFRKFAPVEKLAQALNVNDLNGISLKDVRFTFEFANGRVLVQPFHVKVKDIDMEIGGTQGFDQSIDYLIGMKLPRSILGSQGNALINNLTQQANSKGIPVKLSDYINLTVQMGGTLTNPQIKTGLKETGGDVTTEIKQQAANFAKQAVDSAKTVVAGKTNELKDSAKAITNQAIQDLQKDLGKALSGKKDSTGSSGKTLENAQKNAEQTLKNTLNNLFNKKSAVKDSTKSK
ncbi:MAG: AsmA-like C-terminal region-containing protein, partial [Chitinophagales bacterium]